MRIGLIKRILIITLMIFLIGLTCIRYCADAHFNHAMRMIHQGNIEAHLVSCKKAVALNPYVLNYTNRLGLTYMQMAMKSLKEGADRKVIAGWLTKTMVTVSRVQRNYPNEYWSAAMLRDSYMILDKLSSVDMSRYIEKYTRIMKQARPYH